MFDAFILFLFDVVVIVVIGLLKDRMIEYKPKVDPTPALGDKTRGAFQLISQLGIVSGASLKNFTIKEPKMQMEQLLLRLTWR